MTTKPTCYRLGCKHDPCLNLDALLAEATPQMLDILIRIVDRLHGLTPVPPEISEARALLNRLGLGMTKR